ncbi:MAG: Molybdenum cofactor guanylyltransferase [Stygiobacter sp.]|nr:MAG: Molybdenum cofactor guanylyltransferase [Stygiobacter sp.]
MKALAGIILAGGLARRMGGGDKPLREVAGIPLLQRVIDRLQPQVHCLALSANGPPDRFARFGLPVIADVIPGHQGPLAGILSGLYWARAQGLGHCLSAAGDSPLLPLDLALGLWRHSQDGSRVAVATSGERQHPVFGLWPVRLIEAMEQALAAQQRGLWCFAQAQGAGLATWPAQPIDPFFNVNTPDDVEILTELLRPR